MGYGNPGNGQGLGGNGFEDHTKDFILKAQKRFELIHKKKRHIPNPSGSPAVLSNILLPPLPNPPNVQMVQVFDHSSPSSSFRPNTLNRNSDPLPPPLMMMDSNLIEPEKGNREEEIIELLPIEKRIKRQSSQPSDSGSVGQSDFDRILESLSQQSQQLADQFQELKRLTENLADGLRNLQERAGVSTESLRASASTLGNDLRDRWRQFIRSVNDSVSNLSIEDIKNGLRNSISSSSSNDRGSTISPADQSAIDSVVSEILSSGTTTTESPLSSVQRQVSSLLQGAENFFSRQNDQAEEGLRNFMVGLSDLTNRFLRPRNERTTTRLPGYFVTEGPSTSSTTRQSTEQS